MFRSLKNMLTDNGGMIMLLPNEKGSGGYDPIKTAEDIASVSEASAYVQIIYPYPKLKGAMFFFSEKRLPKESELYFDPVLCGKGAVLDDIFMLMIRREKPESECIFSKMSFSRKPQFRIRTDIIEEGGKLYAEKTALPESIEHVNRLMRSYNELSGIFSKGIISIDRCEKYPRDVSGSILKRAGSF